MLTEQFLVPYNTSHPEGKKWIVFAPHPDDETIGMGGTLIWAKTQNIGLNIVFMTSGDKGGKTLERESEAENAAKALGANAFFLKLPDRQVMLTTANISTIINLIKEISPDAIFFPSPQEYHPDHRVTAMLVWKAQQQLQFKGAVYHYEISRQSEANCLVDITKQMGEKVKTLNLYQSQLSQNNYVAIMQAINTSRTYTLPKEVEFAEAFFKYEQKRAHLNKGIEEKIFQNLNRISSNDWPSFSVLIRTKNRKHRLIRALNSVKKQQYDGKIEIVIVNDGGEDITNIINNFDNFFWKITYINNANSLGRSAAANIAMSAANGQFLNFLDDDDELDPHHFSLFVSRWLRNKEIEILYRGVRLLDNNNQIVKEISEPFSTAKLAYRNFMPIHSVTFDRKFLDMGCCFDEQLECFEDWDFWIQLSRLSRFNWVNEVSASYHACGDSFASSKEGELSRRGARNYIREKWHSKWSALEWDLSLRELRREKDDEFNRRILALKSIANKDNQ